MGTAEFNRRIDRVLAAVDWWDSLGTTKRVMLKVLFNLDKSITGIELVNLYEKLNEEIQ